MLITRLWRLGPGGVTGGSFARLRSAGGCMFLSSHFTRVWREHVVPFARLQHLGAAVCVGVLMMM